MNYVAAITAALALGSARAHMVMSYPPAMMSIFNKNTPSGLQDTDLRAPLTNFGPELFPCKGYQKFLKSTTGLGTPVATYSTGEDCHFSIEENTANHGGGSCQLALSYDLGKTFNVIHSYVGGCGFSGDYKFKMPSDAPTGKQVLFAWVSESPQIT